MARRRARVDISHRGRRLVERVIKLHVDKATTYFYASQTTTLAEANEANAKLARRTQEAKRFLLEYIARLEKTRHV